MCTIFIHKWLKAFTPPKVLVVPWIVVGGSVVVGHVVGGGQVGVLVVGLQLLSPKMFFLSSLTVKRNKYLN